VLFTVFGDGTTADLGEVLREVQAGYNLVVDTFEFLERELPEHITVFYYDTEETCEQGTSIIPVASAHRTIWHISSQDNIVDKFVVTLPSFVVKKETASNLLRRGLSAVVTIDRDELMYGIGVIRDLWLATARIGGGASLDTAIKNILNTSRTEIEQSLVDSVLNCE
jgi:hypothetical protein